MVRRSTFTPLLLVAVLCTAVAAKAQEPVASEVEGGPPAHVSHVEGTVTLEREGRIDDAPANMPLLAGDRLRTRAGRAEILFADGSTLHLDQETTLDLQSDELVRLLAGRVRLSIPGPSREIVYRIDSAHGWAQIADAGEYRAAFVQNELEVAVLRGRAELINEDGRTSLRAGERAFARANAAPSYAYVFNSASWDSFDRWSEERRSERLGLSTQYLPDEVRPYAASFDRYGSWRYESSYGYVWYPRVDVGWRPYYRGRWVTLRPYGVTWVSVDPWGWPTHHYGRWGFSAGTWFWIPGRTWGPAWVSWAYAPGYVSWCPLGWNNRPVIQIVNVNIYRGYDPWRAWTVVSHRNFGGGYVHRNVVDWRRIDDRTRGSFAHRERAPDIVGYAVPRGSVGAAPIRVAGTAPSRRNPSPMLTNRGQAGIDGSRSAAPSRSVDRDIAVQRGDRNAGGSGRPAASEPTRERAIPSRPMIRSDRGAAATSPGQDRTNSGSRASPRRGTDHPAYTPDDRRAEPSRPRGPESPVRRDLPTAVPRGGDASRSNDLPIYNRDDGYRARPDTYAPTDRRAMPGGTQPNDRATYGRPPSYGAPPSYRPPAASEPRRGESNRPPAASEPRRGGSDRGPTSAPPPSSGGSDRGSARPAEGSRPRGGNAPSRGTARPRGGG